MQRTIINTQKQIIRSGWIAWSSVAVMTLAFFVGSVFAGIAYIAHLYIQSIETRDNVLVFFEVGTDPALIKMLSDKWNEFPKIKEIGFTSEEVAYTTFLKDAAVFDPVQYQLLLGKEEKKLESTLDIRLFSLADVTEVQVTLQKDIDAELAKLDFDAAKPPIYMKVDDESINEARDVLLFVRVSGLVLLALLFTIIFFFVLLTVEYRTYNRMEEIGVMQLVGGSLPYIRSPFIFEGAFYGAVGASLSALTLVLLGWFIFGANSGSTVSEFIRLQLRGISLPQITNFGWALFILGNAVVGGIFGAAISYMAIRRYIK